MLRHCIRDLSRRQHAAGLDAILFEFDSNKFNCMMLMVMMMMIMIMMMCMMVHDEDGDGDGGANDDDDVPFSKVECSW